MPELKDLENLKDLINGIVGDGPGSLVVVVISVLTVAALIGRLVLDAFKLPFVVGGSLYRLVRNTELRRRAARRARFARYIGYEIRRIDDDEDWQDERFTELQAEVEVRGRLKVRGLIPSFIWPGSTLHRANSLTRALKRSKERLILLEGDPGSGKSVALRHVAKKLADRAARRPWWWPGSVLPVYVNLRELRPNGSAVDAELIRSFVLRTLNRNAARDTTRYLEEEFDRGLEQRAWLLLFDSFDEIPEILSATDADDVVQAYTNAIVDFLHGPNECRGVIASREFRGPRPLRTARWPRFRVVGLSERRRRRLIRRAGFDHQQATALRVALHEADPAVKELSENPLFLGLMCEYVREYRTVPSSSHEVFEAYVTSRFARDEGHLAERFGISSEGVRGTAEQLAFCMASEPGLGLSPTRAQLLTAMRERGFRSDHDAEVAMNALEYIRLARPQDRQRGGDPQVFSFAHRRFQEYFATCIAIREPQRISARELLFNGRWRETAVTVCQLQSGQTVHDLLEEADDALTVASREVGGDSAALRAILDGDAPKLPRRPFRWPGNSLHILGILDAGFAAQDDKLPTGLRQKADDLLLSAANRGMLHDHKVALDVAGTASPKVLAWLVRAAFERSSPWLRESAYRQVGRLRHVPPEMAADIRLMLVAMAVGGHLWRQSAAVGAQLKRLDRPRPFLAVKRLLVAIPFWDLALHLILVGWLVRALLSAGGSLVSWRFGQYLAVAVLSHLLVYPLRAIPSLSATRTSFRLPLNVGLGRFQHGLIVGLAVALAIPRLWLLGLTPMSPGLLRFALYVVSWSPCALWAAVVGSVWVPISWILPQTIVVDRAFRFAGAAVSGAWRSLRAFRLGRAVRTLAGAVLTLLALALALVGVAVAFVSAVRLPVASAVEALSWAVDFLRPRLEGLLRLPPLSEAMQARLGLGAIALLTAIFVLGLLRSAHRDLRRYLFFQRWLRRLDKPIDGRRLLGYLRRTKSSDELVRLLTRIQERELLEERSDVWMVISDLMVADEHLQEAARDRPGGTLRLAMLTSREGLREAMTVVVDDLRRELWEYRVGRQPGLRRWPPFQCPYFERWITSYVGSHVGRRPKRLFGVEVADEFGKIMEGARPS